MPTNTLSERTIRFLILMIFLAAAMETDIYLPAFPDMMVAFDTNETMIQRVLSFNFLGICLASLIYGPLSDAIGRRSVLNVGYALFILGSIGCVFSTDINVLIFWRFVQGFGSAACMIIGAAMVFDLYKAEKATEIVSDLNSLVVSIIAFAPMLGGWINYQFGYTYNFVFIAALTIVTGLICFIQLPESLPVEKRKPLSIKGIGSDYVTVLKNGEFWANTLITTAIFSGYMVFISNMPLIFVNHLGIDSAVFPFYQVSLLVAFVIASINNGRLIKWFGVNSLRRYGFLTIVLMTLAMFVLPTSWQQLPLLITSLMVLYSLGAGVCIGIFFARSMEAVPNQTGVSASLVTAIRLALVALVIDISGAMFDGTMTSVINLISGCILLSVFIYLGDNLRAKRHKKTASLKV
ncbi:Bcr/CflA family drug resistance efflux transporter [Enterovibrio norvegicus FF-33]|uniref:multidrug effflux MFS transporter n=1 Tax=Enterovibrio norvegicus TaxID=188144 RepID=UPI0002E05708|nr:multidrug effflux MFS transporter [Enterovibrio norvegicus]OEE66723.1 Bcr/CflA family drug resistance efflux transporter [Enterovibrio norvegicus FF-33]